MKLTAVYRPVPASMADQQPTLIYNRGDGFSWMKTPENNAYL